MKRPLYEKEPTISPVEGLRMYVRNWRKAVADHHFAGAQETRDFRQTLKQILHPMQPGEHVAAFNAMLDATDRYIAEVFEPAYTGQPAVKRQLDHYWAGRNSVYCTPAENLPVTKNGLRVARMFIDCWLEQTGIGKGLPQYDAVVAASKQFELLSYGPGKGPRNVGR